MKFMVFVAVLAASTVTAFPDGRPRTRYSAPARLNNPEVIVGRRGYQAPHQQCGPNEILNTDGSCGIPEVNRKIYVFAAKPQIHQPIIQEAPEPEVNIDVILVKTPEDPNDSDPLVVPPPEQKTIVYVLSKRPQGGQEIIEVPSQPEKPEVYFVNYEDGDNPELPGGIDLKTALAQADQNSGGSIGGGFGDQHQGYNNYS